MLQRLPPFARSKRGLLGAGALICYAAAIVLSPSDVRSQLDGSRPKDPIPLQVHVDQPPEPVSPEGDAFAPRAVVDDPQPAPPVRALAPLPRLPVAPTVVTKSLPSFRVTALVTGTQPTALIDSEGTTRVVNIGDALDGSTIERIDDAGIRLANGRQFSLEPASGR